MIINIIIYLIKGVQCCLSRAARNSLPFHSRKKADIRIFHWQWIQCVFLYIDCIPVDFWDEQAIGHVYINTMRILRWYQNKKVSVWNNDAKIIATASVLKGFCGWSVITQEMTPAADHLWGAVVGFLRQPNSFLGESPASGDCGYKLRNDFHCTVFHNVVRT